MMSPQEQLERIKFGTADFINDEDMLKKLKRSIETKKPLNIKLGADPTRPDIHLGHTVVINKLKTFQDLGHKVSFLIGDFTAMIGDPSGKNSTRPMLTREEIEENGRSYAKQIFKILDPEKTEIVYNSSWIMKMTPAEFITMTSKYTVAQLLEREDFTKRYRSGTPIGIHEFIYPLTQGYDSVALKTDVELGGTDQKFNLLVGRAMQAAYGMEAQCVLTMPILEGIDGVNKMSKSLDNYISVVDTPKDMFGKTMRISDELMYRWYELLTDVGAAGLNQLRADVAEGRKHPRTVKVELAKFLIKRFHSQAEAQAAEDEFNRIFVEKGLPDEVPDFEVEAETQMGLAALMVKAQLAASNSEAGRLIQGGGVQIDGEKVSDPRLKIDLKSGASFVLKAGKKKFVKIVVK
ncbi:tyrosine--tRNA ligase [Bdellovibrio bacteriovorus]|uniref:Tyrosine--tRNA ligase n=1 Tax=Bdellovibrio bacteriovorus (strain ATCC 15356 / DSM 50701 / NCIMB 9529 / HD100) TaxID=264462 RepID=SYY_BDEBA|nr:tyrosine--tRNA ligase [Bdellovibrio bacteriovorus]Q6MNQ2.1 RecName: Full=Tyrosine--tRNA ligase; AltName: Full=Tyrosyl-tRNA synthetase; Short=TyrRS [Bdellovibrio bacteriovorus HD100]CAE79099.1 tyrS [Bdellovibrio bacteriovorus HD100]